MERQARPAIPTRRIAIAAVAAGLLAAAPAAASVTIGSGLPAMGGASTPTCGGPAVCTHSQKSAPGLTVSSPVNGTVVRWSFRGAAGPVTVRLRVLRPEGASALFLGASAPQTEFGGDEVHTYPTSLPIAAGDRIAIEEDTSGGGNLVMRALPGALTDIWAGTPAPGALAAPFFSDFPGFELRLNAEIEPDNALTGVRVKPRKNGTALLRATAPNAGGLTAAAAKTVKSKPPRRFVKTTTARAAGPGPVRLVIRPDSIAKQKLRKKGKARGPVRVTFTPDGGTAASQVIQVKLKRKRKRK